MKIFTRIFCFLILPFFVSQTHAFIDVAQDDPDRAIFEHIRDVKIIQQFPDGNFHPTALVTKAEGLAFALRAGGIAIPAEFDIENIPTDVDPNSWQAPVLARARELKITSSNIQNFLPNNPISKAEYLAFLFRATKVNFDPFFSKTDIPATDIPAEEWFSPHFRYAKKYGIAHVAADGNYYPWKALSRREVAVMTYRQLRMFHGDAATKKFAELQAHIDEFVRAIRVDDQKKATAHLQKILDLSRAVTLQRNDKNAIAVIALSRSLKNLITSLQAVRFGNTLKAVESLHLASNFAERASQKSEEIAPVAEQIAHIIDETLDNLARPQYAKAY